MSIDPSSSTATVARILSREDPPRSLRAALGRAARRVGVLWASAAVSGVVLHALPAYAEFGHRA